MRSRGSRCMSRSMPKASGGCWRSWPPSKGSNWSRSRREGGRTVPPRPPICSLKERTNQCKNQKSSISNRGFMGRGVRQIFHRLRSEEHTSELQSPCNLVCRLLLEKKKKQTYREVTCGKH